MYTGGHLDEGVHGWVHERRPLEECMEGYMRAGALRVHVEGCMEGCTD